MNRALTIFAYAWGGLVIATNLAAIAGMLMTADTLWSGWSRVADTYSPFNIVNWLLNVLLLLPAIGALYWRNKRREEVR